MGAVAAVPLAQMLGARKLHGLQVIALLTTDVSSPKDISPVLMSHVSHARGSRMSPLFHCMIPSVIYIINKLS